MSEHPKPSEHHRSRRVNWDDLADVLRGVKDLEIRRDEPLSAWTSMGVGGRMPLLLTVHSRRALEDLLVLLNKENEGFFLLGGGTNIIVRDEALSRVVLRLGSEFCSAKREKGDRLVCGAGAGLGAVVSFSRREGLSGLEFCVGIPGTVGGALAGNAGAFGEAICDRVEFVEGYRRDGTPIRLSQGEFSHSYRRSDLADYLIVHVQMILKSAPREQIQKRIDAYLKKRYIQPVGVKSSGCVFKNPEGDSAGRLIESAGLKGYTVGGAEVSRDHANYIINKNQATSEEVLLLIQHIQCSVKRRFNIELKLEVEVI